MYISFEQIERAATDSTPRQLIVLFVLYINQLDNIILLVSCTFLGLVGFLNVLLLGGNVQ